jgi:hypothetical protein
MHADACAVERAGGGEDEKKELEHYLLGLPESSRYPSRRILNPLRVSSPGSASNLKEASTRPKIMRHQGEEDSRILADLNGTYPVAPLAHDQACGRIRVRSANSRARNLAMSPMSFVGKGAVSEKRIVPLSIL